MTQHTKVTLAEERACPDCGVQDLALALYTTGGVPCLPCRIRRGVERALEVAAAGAYYCAVCEVELTLGGRRQHENSRFHKSLSAALLEAPAVLALAKRETA